jgi:hypothetical protein
MKNIRQKRVDLSSLKLSPEEGFVLSRVDGSTTVKELVALTGLDESRIVDIVGRLRDEGVVEVDSPSPSDPIAGQRAPREVPSAIDNELLAFLHSDREESAAGPEQAELELIEVHDTPEAGEESDSPPPEEGAEADAVPPEEGAEADAVAAPESEEQAEREAHDEREYRKIYEAFYRAMNRDERIKAATDAAGSHLLALCLDSEPQVIHAVLSNHRVTLDCPRLVATHHRTHVGLENIAKRSDFIADSIVQRRLLRNPQLPGTILNRIVNPKLMMDVYKIAIDREIPERSRSMTREILRKKFMVSSSDERAALLFKTEGRCLVLLANCSLDAHATQILCSKSTFTILFIQNLARWSATPPTLLAHLSKMQVVRRNTGLKKMIMKHPNTPSELKRGAH